METYRRLEDLIVYQKLCQLHIEANGISHKLPESDRRWPQSSVRENGEDYNVNYSGFPEFTTLAPEPRTMNPE